MPLAHMLLPQLAKKAEEIEAALGHRPEQIGYLQASAPPTASAQGLKELRSRPAQSPDQAFKGGAARGYDRESRVQERKLIPIAPTRPAPSYAQGAGGIQTPADFPIGMTESGRPIYATDHVPQPARQGKRTVIQMPKGAIGQNEQGQAVDVKGKKLGYLAQDPNVRTLERRSKDVSLGEKDTYDQFGVQTLQRDFGEHLKAMQENRDRDGMPTDKFPTGYFRGMDPRRKKEIEAGVKRLQEIERGHAI